MSDELGSVRPAMFELATFVARAETHDSSLITHHFDLARLRTYPQHTCAWLPLLRSRPGGVHRRGVVRSPKSDNLSKTFAILNCRRRIVKWQFQQPRFSLELLSFIAA